MYILSQTGEESCTHCKSVLKVLRVVIHESLIEKMSFLIVSRTYLNHSEYKLIHIKEEDDDDDVGEH